PTTRVLSPSGAGPVGPALTSEGAAPGFTTTMSSPKVSENMAAVPKLSAGPTEQGTNWLEFPTRDWVAYGITLPLKPTARAESPPVVLMSWFTEAVLITGEMVPLARSTHWHELDTATTSRVPALFTE